MTIKQQGGIFGRNPTFNDVTVDGSLSVAGGTSITGDTDVTGTATSKYLDVFSGVLSEEYQARIGFSDQFHWTLGRENATTGDFYIKSVSAGTPTEIARFASTGLKFPNGKGIDFSATSGTGTSELFDDYEEGTWYPTITNGTSTVTSTNLCQYVKVGGMVFASVVAYNVNLSSLSGNLSLGGLPFTVGGTNASQIIATLGTMQPILVDFANGAVTGSLFTGPASGQNLTAITSASFASSTNVSIWGSITYRAQ